MTAQELKMAAWEIDATVSATIANLERIYEYSAPIKLDELADIAGQIEDEIASLQVYAHALQAEAAKEGAE